MISQALRKHQTSIIRHLNDFASHQKITSENGGSNSYLSEVQTTLMIENLSEITYFHIHDIREYINNTVASDEPILFMDAMHNTGN